MNSSTTKILGTLEDLQAEAATFVRGLTGNDDHALLVTLTGELGAGKTSFTQGMASALGVTENITSPTFVLEKVYELSGQTFSRLIHIDAYRLEGENSLAPLGFSELYVDSKNLIVLEWPERVETQLPKADHALSLRVVEDGREITYV